MNIRSILIIICLAVTMTPCFGNYPAPDHPLFDGDAVHEIHLTFSQSNWWEQLRSNFEGQDDPIYLEAGFRWSDIELDTIGVRFKGNSSYNYPGEKKSFKLDFDEFVDGQEVYGLDKLNLNNVFLDPSFVREKVCYEICEAAGLPTVRTNYAAVYINGTYWGLYLLVEQFDQEFIEGRFGASEGGNLWKGEDHGSMEYLGDNESAYYSSYELKTNEEENDWSAIVELTDGLNNTATADLPAVIEPLIDVHSALTMLAIDNLTVNLDSYIGRCVNYYFYHRDSDSRVTFAKWDVNESWGIFTFNMSVNQLQQLDPYWTSTSHGEYRPLAEKLWSVDAYDTVYRGILRRMMVQEADPDTLMARMGELRNMIQSYVYNDSNKMFSNSEFDSAMSSNINEGHRTIPALETFIRNRHAYLQSTLGTWTPVDGLVINELSADNVSVMSDEQGDFDDWIEITNTSSAPIALNGLSLTDDLAVPNAYVFPNVTLSPGEYLIVWADGEPGQGDYHAEFKLDSDGESLFLMDSGVIVDTTLFPALGSDKSWGRLPDGTGDWTILGQASPGAANQEYHFTPVELFINEFMADNVSTIEDPESIDAYPDWIEIYNAETVEVDMSGMYLTDDINQPTKYAIPTGVTISAGGFVLFWADSDDEQGVYHTNFKLSKNGEAIYLFAPDGQTLIDSIVFDAQSTDVSMGRYPDGTDFWDSFDNPTPGTSNQSNSGASTGMKLVMADNDLETGDRFYLYFSLLPAETDYSTDVYILLDVMGLYYSWPDWIPIESGLGFQTHVVNPGNTDIVSVFDFTWPEVSAPLSGLYFYGAAFEPGNFNLIGDVQIIEFQYR